MKYFAFMFVSLIGGGLLITAALDEILPMSSILVLIAGILSLGSGRRMLQRWLHSRNAS